MVWCKFQPLHSRLKSFAKQLRSVCGCSLRKKVTLMIPILRSTRGFTVAGLAAGTLVTAGLVGQLALHQDNSAVGKTVPTQQATTSTGAASSSASSASSSKSTSYSQVPAVHSAGTSSSDSNTRGS